MALTHGEVLEQAEKSSANALEQLSSDPEEEGGSCDDLDALRGSLRVAARALAQECNKLALSFRSRPHPTPEETLSICAGMESSLVALLSTVYSMDAAVLGRHLRKEVRCACAEATEAAGDLVRAVRGAAAASTSSEESILRAVGCVWENCDRLSEDGKGLSKDGAEACLKVLRAERDVIKDAVFELEEALEDDGDEAGGGEEEPAAADCAWTDQDRKLASTGVGLTKVAHATLKKSVEVVRGKQEGAAANRELLEEMDAVTAIATKVSPKVDDFAMSLYPPADAREATTTAAALVGAVAETLQAFAGERQSLLLVLEERGQGGHWVDFLTKALDHNREKVDTILAERQMGEMAIT